MPGCGLRHAIRFLIGLALPQRVVDSPCREAPPAARPQENPPAVRGSTAGLDRLSSVVYRRIGFISPRPQALNVDT